MTHPLCSHEKPSTQRIRYHAPPTPLQVFSARVGPGVPDPNGPNPRRSQSWKSWWRFRLAIRAWCISLLMRGSPQRCGLITLLLNDAANNSLATHAAHIVTCRSGSSKFRSKGAIGTRG